MSSSARPSSVLQLRVSVHGISGIRGVIAPPCRLHLTCALHSHRRDSSVVEYKRGSAADLKWPGDSPPLVWSLTPRALAQLKSTAPSVKLTLMARRVESGGVQVETAVGFALLDLRTVQVQPRERWVEIHPSAGGEATSTLHLTVSLQQQLESDAGAQLEPPPPAVLEPPPPAVLEPPPAPSVVQVVPLDLESIPIGGRGYTHYNLNLRLTRLQLTQPVVQVHTPHWLSFKLFGVLLQTEPFLHSEALNPTSDNFTLRSCLTDLKSFFTTLPPVQVHLASTGQVHAVARLELADLTSAFPPLPTSTASDLNRDDAAVQVEFHGAEMSADLNLLAAETGELVGRLGVTVTLTPLVQVDPPAAVQVAEAAVQVETPDETGEQLESESPQLESAGVLFLTPVQVVIQSTSTALIDPVIQFKYSVTPPLDLNCAAPLVQVQSLRLLEPVLLHVPSGFKLHDRVEPEPLPPCGNLNLTFSTSTGPAHATLDLNCLSSDAVQVLALPVQVDADSTCGDVVLHITRLEQHREPEREPAPTSTAAPPPPALQVGRYDVGVQVEPVGRYEMGVQVDPPTPFDLDSAEAAWFKSKRAAEAAWLESCAQSESARLEALEKRWMAAELERSSTLAASSETVARLESKLRRMLVALGGKERELEARRLQMEADLNARTADLNAVAKRLREDGEHAAAQFKLREASVAARVSDLKSDLETARAKCAALESDCDKLRFKLAAGPELALRDAVARLEGEAAQLKSALQRALDEAQVHKAARETAELEAARCAREVLKLRSDLNRVGEEETARLRVAYLSAEERYVLEGDRSALRDIRRQVDAVAVQVGTTVQVESAASAFARQFPPTAPPPLPLYSTPRVPHVVEVDRLKSQRRALVESHADFNAGHPLIRALDRRISTLELASRRGGQAAAAAAGADAEEGADGV